MSEPHRIRLRGPWEVTAIECTNGATLTNAIRMTIPCSWREGGWIGFQGRALHTRAFGKPTGLDGNHSVFLVIESATGSGWVRLNGQNIGEMQEQSMFECDITSLLKPRNLLEIELAADHDGGGVTGEPCIEIRQATG